MILIAGLKATAWFCIRCHHDPSNHQSLTYSCTDCESQSLCHTLAGSMISRLFYHGHLAVQCFLLVCAQETMGTESKWIILELELMNAEQLILQQLLQRGNMEEDKSMS